MIRWLQKWFYENCNGDWEHLHVIKIETIDNPGWSIEIDFNDTNTVIDNISYELYEAAENDWIGYSVKDGIYHGIGDSLKLNQLISIFKELSS